jgi:iron complex outermembrane receptor protein
VRKLGLHQSITAKIAQGYSPPSIAEMRPSAGIINTNLKAEKGWNKEIAWKGESNDKSFNWDLTAYLFNLNETIVVRRAADGSDYFANVGETTQKGLELTTTWKAHKYLLVNNSTTWQDFRFTDYTTAGKTYNGNFLTGTSPFQNSFLAIYNHPSGFSWNQQYIFSDYLYLNDANTDQMPAYRIWNTKISYQKSNRKFGWELWFALENILNETYSLGPDLNAAAGRYYNAAPGRNFSIGLKINTY